MYQALYRKWRPQQFADVVGQDHITTTLMNEINEGRHSHAYLFTGSRGTGKTTCAKIFAKAVNCEHPVNGDPCNECETCRGIDNGSVMDVIEIDAASNNGVDNIREIRDEANFTPASGKYRVYIIDEVHMLSAGAFNALLKTLEEPPEHVKFVLATTEVHKLPATILSRCQRFDFKRITPEDIAGRLAYIAEQEGLELSSEAAMLIARLADGALRDALSIMDQCIGHSRNITTDVVNETVGLAGKVHLFALSTSILNKDGASALSQINDLHNRSCDMERLCNELTNHFRNLMICKAVKDPSDLIICSAEELGEYQKIASSYSMDFILEVLNVLGDTLQSLRSGLDRRVEMEMSILRLCQSGTASLLDGATPATAPVVAAPAPVPKPEPKPAPKPEPETEIIPEPEPEPVPESEPESEPEVISEPEPESLPIDEYIDYEDENFEDAFASLLDDTPTYPEEPKEEEEEPAPPIEFAPKIVEPETEEFHESAPLVFSAPPIEEPAPTSYTVSDGRIPTNIWNAFIREVVSTDKALIGTMNSAKAYKLGGRLVIDTDNILLRRFLPMDFHKKTIGDATFTIFGEYLIPSFPLEGEVFDTVSDASAQEPEPKQEAEKVPAKAVEFDPIKATAPIREFDENPVAEKTETFTEIANADPLDDFIGQLDGQIDFGLLVED